jgi:hypothetical protein
MCKNGREVPYSEQGQVDAIEGEVGDAIGSETKDCESGDKLKDSEGKDELWQSQNMISWSGHFVGVVLCVEGMKILTTEFQR